MFLHKILALDKKFFQEFLPSYCVALLWSNGTLTQPTYRFLILFCMSLGSLAHLECYPSHFPLWPAHLECYPAHFPLRVGFLHVICTCFYLELFISIWSHLLFLNTTRKNFQYVPLFSSGFICFYVFAFLLLFIVRNF